VKAPAKSVGKWFAGLVKSDFAQNLSRDFKSLRALWNWFYLALYAWICVWAVLHYPDSINTAITVTGSVVSVIFTGYVATRSYEKARCCGAKIVKDDKSEEFAASD
jgi:hypothetical protein